MFSFLRCRSNTYCQAFVFIGLEEMMNVKCLSLYTFITRNREKEIIINNIHRTPINQEKIYKEHKGKIGKGY